MKSLSDFGTADHPLRCSSLDALIRCPMQRILLHLGEAEDVSGPAADTGSVAHHGIAAYHRATEQEEGIGAGLAAMRDCLDRFPLADLSESERHFEGYVRDPRNSTAEIVAVEQAVSLVLPPTESDPTGQAIHITGTCDQVRRHHGQLVIVDVKTGSTPGWQMLHDHLFQICAYALAATEHFGTPVVPGFLVRTRGYLKKDIDPRTAPDGIVYEFNLTLQRCRLYLDQIREQVARVRRGDVDFGPGAHCSFCPLGGVWACTARAEKFL